MGILKDLFQNAAPGQMVSIDPRRFESGLGIGVSTIQGNGYQEAQSSFIPEFGVLYDGKTTLPDDWAGAKITSFTRMVGDKGWHITFSSKWDSGLDIRLRLDVEQVNGAEANTIASTYMEALNQRRVG